MALIYLCPADKRLSCSWEGYASDLRAHFENDHPALFHATHQIPIDLQTNDNQVIFLEDELYLLRTTIEDTFLMLRLHYLGSSMIAFKKQYDLTVSIDGRSYCYDAKNSVNYVVPNGVGWNINLRVLRESHGSVNKVLCSIVIEDTEKCANIKRHNSSVRIKKQGSMSSAMHRPWPGDAIDENSNRLQSQDKVRQCDLMDNISVLNLSILEEPFARSKHNSVVDDGGLFDLESFSDVDEAELTCGSCATVMIPPIFVCNNGHDVCAQCRRTACKTCKGYVTKYRNEELEELSRQHKHVCKYAADGCLENKLFYLNVNAHQTHCTFCPYKCQIDWCNYSGVFQKFCKHLSNLHFSCKVRNTLSNEFPKNVVFYITNERSGVFYCKSEQINEDILWQVTFCGPSEKSFVLELVFKGSKYKNVIFLSRQNNTYSYRVSMAELRKNRAKDKYACLLITPISMRS